MNITKQQIKQIIKEEIKSLQENETEELEGEAPETEAPEGESEEAAAPQPGPWAANMVKKFEEDQGYVTRGSYRGPAEGWADTVPLIIYRFMEFGQGNTRFGSDWIQRSGFDINSPKVTIERFYEDFIGIINDAFVTPQKDNLDGTPRAEGGKMGMPPMRERAVLYHPEADNPNYRSKRPLGQSEPLPRTARKGATPDGMPYITFSNAGTRDTPAMKWILIDKPGGGIAIGKAEDPKVNESVEAQGMRLTKQQLKNIIKEEIINTLQEGLRFDHEPPFGRERDPTGPSASVGRAFANYDFEKELIDLLFYDVKDAIEDGDSLEKIFDQVKADRDEPRMTHHRELDGIADKHIWKAITTIEKMDDED